MKLSYFVKHCNIVMTNAATTIAGWITDIY